MTLLCGCKTSQTTHTCPVYLGTSMMSSLVDVEPMPLGKPTPKRKYDATIARIAGNIMSGYNPMLLPDGSNTLEVVTVDVEFAVRVARMIIAEVTRTEPVKE